MGRFVWVCVCLLAGCGRLGFDAAGHAGSGSAIVFPDGGVPSTGTCGTSVLVQDGFDSGMPGPQFQLGSASGLTVSETGSHLQVDFAASVGANTYTEYDSQQMYPEEGLCASIEILRVPNGDGNVYMKLATASLDQVVELFEHGGSIDLRTHANKKVTILATFPMDLATTRFWRMRQQGGVTYWETSADGASYVTQAQAAFLSGDPVTFALGAGTFQSLSGGGAAWLDSALLTGP